MDKQNNEILLKLREYNTNIYVNDIFRVILKKEREKKLNRIDKLFVFILFMTSIFISSVILLANILMGKDINYYKEIAFARVYRYQVKIQRVYGKIQIITDDIVNRDYSLYRVGSRVNRLYFLIFEYVSLCMDDYKSIYEITLENEILPYSKEILSEMVKRIPHTVIYKYSIENIVSNYNLEKIYTGQMYDRYALAEEQISRRYNKCLVCIPHGIETIKEMPVGYVGDVFYSSSTYMALKLNEVYKTSKFIFDEDIVKKMYNIELANNQNQGGKEKKIVFFTQPQFTSETKEIISSIAKQLNDKNKKLYIKIHPLEKSKDYIIDNTEIINDFGQAISTNICISLASTVLIEALYNESYSISIINVLQKNFNLDYYSDFLDDSRILKPNSEEDLIGMINKILN